MINHQNYRNAPIVEAVFDVFTTLQSDFDLKKLESFHSKIKDRFPEKNESITIKNSIGFKDGQPITPSAEKFTRGYVYQDKVNARAVQARIDGFTFNKLKPYSSFESFIQDAKPLWELYKEVLGSLRINRISFRYINTIALPSPVNDLKEYFLTYPEIGAGIPQKMNNFFNSFEIEDPSTSAIGNVIQTIGDSTPDFVNVIFDITVFKNVSIKSEADGELWTVVNKLRDFKNLIFNNSLSDKTKEMIK